MSTSDTAPGTAETDHRKASARTARRAPTTVVVLVLAVLGVLVGALVLGSLLEAIPEQHRTDAEWRLVPVVLAQLLMGVAAIAVVPLVRSGTWTASVAVIVLGALSPFAAPAACYALVVVAATWRGPRAWVAGALLVAGSVGSEIASRWFLPSSATTGEIVVAAVVVAAVVAVLVLTGRARGLREAAVAALRHEAESARREQHERVLRARADERTRIAREMHDTLAHHLSIISVHAGAIEVRDDLDRAQVRTAAQHVGNAVRSATADLRRTLQVLRDGETAVEPPPDLGALAELVHADPTLRFDAAGSADPAVIDLVPATTSRHLYRVVQEAVTNVRRHGDGTPGVLRLSGDRVSGLVLEVRNRAGSIPAGHVSGHGLVGVEERVRLLGGVLRVERRDGDFVLRVEVPWEA